MNRRSFLAWGLRLAAAAQFLGEDLIKIREQEAKQFWYVTSNEQLRHAMSEVKEGGVIYLAPGSYIAPEVFPNGITLKGIR